MSRATLANIVLAKTPEERENAVKAHQEALKNAPSDAERLTAFLSSCRTANDNQSIIGEGESAEFTGSGIKINKEQ